MASRYSMETDRLLLRRWRQEDRDAFLTLATEEEFQWFPLRRAATPEEAGNRFEGLVRHWRENGFGLWAVETKDSGELIGFTGLAIPTFLPEVLPAVELGYRLGRKWWGNGYAAEASVAAIDFAFDDLLANKLLCIYEPENDRSARVAARLGFREVLETKHPEYGLPLKVAELRRVSRPKGPLIP